MELIDWGKTVGLTIQEGLGMTENAASFCINPVEAVGVKRGSAGRTLPYVQMRIVDPDSHTDVPPDTVGELWLKGPTVTPGYWQRDDANAEAFIDGWFRTGDVVRQDADGYLYVEDRVKDMYISGGENVYPAEVENILYQMEAIAEVAVIGVPDPQWGEVGCAVIVAKAGHTVTLADIHTHTGDKLAKYKWPMHVVTYDVLPRNATGKVQKFHLRRDINILRG